MMTFTCAQKLTAIQLNLPDGTKNRRKNKAQNKKKQKPSC